MKCPKCGSGYIIIKEEEIVCAYCNQEKHITNTELEYQQRLDKVLSKMKQGIDNKNYYQIRNNGYLFIDCLINDNYFELHQGGTQFKIPLKTVESLLESLLDGLDKGIKVSNIIAHPTTLMKEPEKPKKTIPTSNRNRGGS